ncbi:MAG: glycoside hydrolase family 3 C-terminal domain-containing protein [Cyanobacteriota bacterium]|nr:glycoside hydrolase family 3 C-terminal domain-containing protein [Cyanobacteriota bacterium]
MNADDLLAQLSTQEKLRLVSGTTPFWSGMADIAFNSASHRHPWPAGQLPRLGLSGLQFVDGPRGVVLEGGATTFPVPMARGASWNPALEEQIGAAMAREARSFGANWLAAVCINLLRHPGWGRAQETYGEDPVHVGELGAACTRGIGRHAIACVKHLALNSIDSSRFLVDVRASRRVLHELYLPHFRDCLEAGAGSVMTAYNRLNGIWCGEHPVLLTEILRQRWGFEGLVVSDFIFGLRHGLAALQAGQDLEMPFRMIFREELSEALADGRLAMASLDAAVRRQLRLQLQVPAGTYPSRLRRCREHLELAREAARQGIVLLRNERLSRGDPVLPLGSLTSLAVIGPLADTPNLGDRGSSDTRPPWSAVVTPLEGLRAACPSLTITHADGRRIRQAAALAARCDAVVLVAGLDWRLEGEHIHPGDIAPILNQIPPPSWLEGLAFWPALNPLWQRFTALIAWITSFASARSGGDFAAGDRTELSLPADQVALIQAVAAANPRTVVVLMGGGAILCRPWEHLVPGLLLLWYPGEQGGHALADVLVGAVSPSGRLPFSIPVSEKQLPLFEPRAPRVDYDLWHGYRKLLRQGEKAAYPFGFGLSYSSFERSDPQARLNTPEQAEGAGQACVELAVAVANHGAMAAADVVQVYLEPPGLLMERPNRVLVAFQRVWLEPGERQRLTLTIPLRRLACFDEQRDRFVVEKGRHRLVVAAHADDPGVAANLDLEERELGG